MRCLVLSSGAAHTLFSLRVPVNSSCAGSNADELPKLSLINELSQNGWGRRHLMGLVELSLRTMFVRDPYRNHSVNELKSTALGEIDSESGATQLGTSDPESRCEV